MFAMELIKSMSFQFEITDPSAYCNIPYNNILKGSGIANHYT